MPIGANTPKRGIENVFVTGFEKRRKPRKHYVYVIVVSWTDHSRYEIYRRYSEFFSFQSTLLQLFPAEAKDKTIPILPKRIFIGRSHVSKVAEARVDSINTYCQRLVNLDERISSNIHVLTFFGPLPGDKPLEKLELGRPASLHPLRIPTGSLWEEHCVVADFEKDSDQQLSVKAGSKVIVVNKDESGWWLIQFRNKSGWVPAAYLQKCCKMENGDDTADDEDSSNYLGFVVEEDSEDTRKSTSPVTPSLDAELYRAIADYEAQEEGQISFEEDQLIHVIDKMEDGWWFVSFDQKEGWAPNSYLEPLQSSMDRESPSLQRGSPVMARILRTTPPPTGSSSGHTSPDEFATEGKYAATESYIAQEPDEISLPQGTVVDVMKKSVEGWWTIRHKGQIGLFPAAFLQKHETESYFLQLKHRKSGRSFYNRAPPPRRRTVRKTTERGRKKAIRKASPRLVRAAENSSTSTSSDSDNYKLCEITDKTSQEDATFWGRKPAATRMRSSSSNSDSSSNESGSHKASRENTPELQGDVKRNVAELKEAFAKSPRSVDDLRRSPHVSKKKYSTGDKPTVVTRSQSSLSDSPNVPARPRQNEIFRSHFANAFTTTPDGIKESSPSPILEDGPSDMEASSRFVVSLTKPRKTAPPTPPRKQSLQNSPSSSPEAQRRRSQTYSEATATESDDNNVLQDKAMEAILKVLLQKNGPELQNLVKQAVASDPELLKLALSNNQ